MHLFNFWFLNITFYFTENKIFFYKFFFSFIEESKKVEYSKWMAYNSLFT